MTDPYTLLTLPLELTARIRNAVVSKLNPHTPSDVRQIWDLWYMPGQYCYLIANADKVLDTGLLAEFRQARDQLTQPLELGTNVSCLEQIHLYVNGMYQGLHNDSSRAGYSYVYYLQDDVKFIGGQTYLFAKDFPDPDEPAAGHAYYEQIEPVCGRMVLFNNSVPHMVPTLQGTMDPTKGRITLSSRLLK